jgi:hypothetical protein
MRGAEALTVPEADGHETILSTLPPTSPDAYERILTSAWGGAPLSPKKVDEKTS